MSVVKSSNFSWFNIIRNVTSGFGGTVVVLLVNFALMPFIISSIGQIGFGIWVLANSLVGYMGLFDVGLQPMLIKKSSEYLAADDHDGLSSTVNTTLLIYVVIGLITGMIFLILAPYLPQIFKIPPPGVQEFTAIILVLGGQTALSFPMAVWRGLVGGLQDYHIINGISVFSNLIKAGFTFLFITWGYGLLALVWLGFGVMILVWFSNFLWVRFRIPDLHFSTRLIKLNKVPELTRFSGSMFIWGVASLSTNQIDKLLIGIYLPLINVTIYEVGFRIYNYSRVIQNSTISILPTASDLHARNENNLLKSIYINTTKYVFMAYMAIVAILLLFGDKFIFLWVGNEFSESVLIMQLLLVGALFQAQNVVAHVMLPGMNRIKEFTIIMSAYPIVKLISGIILINNYGLIGIAISSMIMYISLELIFLKYILKIFKVGFQQFLKEVILPATVTVFPGMILAIILNLNRFIHTWVDFVLIMALVCTMFLLSYLVFVMTYIERDMLRSYYVGLIQKCK